MAVALGAIGGLFVGLTSVWALRRLRRRSARHHDRHEQMAQK